VLEGWAGLAGCDGCAGCAGGLGRLDRVLGLCAAHAVPAALTLPPFAGWLLLCALGHCHMHHAGHALPCQTLPACLPHPQRGAHHHVSW
jgi:hypothetical protein